MPRPVWSGTISFGLIAIPVKLFNAVRRQSVSFNQLDGRDMQRIRYRKVNGETDEVVSDDDIVKGYEVSKGRYVVVDPDELEPFMPAATKSVDLEEFVDLAEIDPVYFDSAYYVAPDGNPKPYVLLARAMEDSGKVAIGRFVMRNKQYTAAIRAENGQLVMSSLAYADEVVDPSSIEDLDGLADVDVSAREVSMAEALVESLTASFEPEKYHDEYREQVIALIRMKADGEEFELPEAAAEKPKVIDIMAALEASVAAAKQARSRHPAQKQIAATAKASRGTSKTAASKTATSKTAASKNGPSKSSASKPSASKSAAKSSASKSSASKSSRVPKAARAKKSA